MEVIALNKKLCMSTLPFVIVMRSDSNVKGSLYSPVLKNNVEFFDLTSLFTMMDKIVDDVNIPRCDEKFRRFNKNSKFEKLEYVDFLDDKALNRYLVTLKNFKTYKNIYFVEIMRRQNYSWQGKVTWLEKKKTKCFRSELELMKLICN